MKTLRILVAAAAVCISTIAGAGFIRESRPVNDSSLSLERTDGEIVKGLAVTTPKDVAKAERIMEIMASREGSTADRMIIAAKEMLGTDYVASTLEAGDKEELRVYTTKTDCIIFVETCLNMARTVGAGHTDFETLSSMVASTRYRGRISSYADRIHYTTEWIRRGEAAGIMKDLTLEIGGSEFPKPINFMSTHYKSYKHLRDADTDPVAAENRRIISEVEKKLNEKPQSWIPAAKIKSIESKIKTGDIIGFMTTTDGLDIGHVAIAYVHDGKVGFIHASQGGGLVMEQPQSIADYVLKVRKGCQGIKVVRPL